MDLDTPLARSRLLDQQNGTPLAILTTLIE
jgi:hypothetical protein